MVAALNYEGKEVSYLGYYFKLSPLFLSPPCYSILFYSILQVTDQSMRAVAEHCPELQFVGFMGCPVTSQGVIHLTAVSITQLFLTCIIVMFLVVTYCNSICMFAYDKA